MKLQNLIHILMGIVCIGLLPNAQAVVPPPDGGYPGGNTAEGTKALLSQTTGGYNTAIGWLSLKGLTTGSFNTGVGAGTLALNNGEQNTAVGAAALLLNNGGSSNTAVGVGALSNNTTGNGNIAIGSSAASNGTTGNNNIDIGNLGDAGDSDTIRIGNDSHHRIFIPAINDIVIGGVPVTIDSMTGLLGQMASSARFKDNIKPMDKASESILALKPVSFRYRKELDAKGIPQFGLIAEEVAKVNPALVLPDKEGKPYTVRYEAVNAMLLNEFLKAHQRMQEQDATIARQQKQIDALSAGLQKVSAQLETSKPAPQVVNNP